MSDDNGNGHEPYLMDDFEAARGLGVKGRWTIRNRDEWQDKSGRNDVAYLEERGAAIGQRMHTAASRKIEDGKPVPKSPWVFTSDAGGR